MKGDKLQPKQILFIKEYLVDKNATQAAKRAGYSARSADKLGNQMLAKPRIRKAIDRELAKLQAEVNKRVAKKGITKERIMRELALIAFADMDDFAVVTKSGVKLVTSADRRKARARVIKKLSESTSVTGGHQSLELNPKIPALELLSKLGGFLVEKKEITGHSGGPIQYESMDSEKLGARRAELETALEAIDDESETSGT